MLNWLVINHYASYTSQSIFTYDFYNNSVKKSIFNDRYETQRFNSLAENHRTIKC